MKQYWVQRPFRYEGIEFDRGQIVTLKGSRSDETLVRAGYLAEFDARQQRHTAKCGTCGHEFTDHSMLYGHGEARHPRRDRTLEEQHQFVERQDTILDQIAPVAI